MILGGVLNASQVLSQRFGDCRGVVEAVARALARSAAGYGSRLISTRDSWVAGAGVAFVAYRVMVGLS